MSEYTIVKLKGGMLFMNGGYHIVNLKDTSLSSTETKINGIYESIEDSYRKPILLSGITIDGVEKPDCFVEVTNSEGSFTITVYGKTITVKADDTVTIA